MTSALAIGTVLAGPAITRAQTTSGTPTSSTQGDEMMPTAVQTGYAPVNGLQMYYEIHGGTLPSSGGGLGGEDEALLLLHGAYGTIDMWGPVLTTLAEQHRVIAVEFQGHGHTADIDRPFSYEQLADDVAVLMEHLGIAQADIVGYSMGGNSGLQLAIRHPQRVRKLVAISANSRSDGYHPEVYESVEAISPEVFAGTPFEQAYMRNAPNPEDWPTLIAKLKTLTSTAFAWPESDLQSIAAPTLLIIGDSDSVRPEHAVEMFRLLGGGVQGDLAGLPASRLAILPGITHITIIFEQTDLPLTMIERFLAAPMPETS
jgi:pimeloyl-ACP methyl ester carboxylesterase